MDRVTQKIILLMSDAISNENYNILVITPNIDQIFSRILGVIDIMGYLRYYTLNKIFLKNGSSIEVTGLRSGDKSDIVVENVATQD